MDLVSRDLRKSLLDDNLLRIFIHLFEVVNFLNQHIYATHAPSDEATLAHQIGSSLVYMCLVLLARIKKSTKTATKSLYGVDWVNNAPAIELLFKYDPRFPAYFTRVGLGCFSEDAFEGMLKIWHQRNSDAVLLLI